MSTRTLPFIASRKQQAADRGFFLVMAIACAVLIFVGFSRTYYLKQYFPAAPALSLLVHVHGAVMTIWVLYFVVQTALIASDRPGLHRKLGYAGAFLGTLVIGLGLTVAFTGMRLHHGTSTQSPEVIFLVGLIDIGSFAMFFITGYLFRRNHEAHQRLMLFAVVVGLTGAPIGRLIALGTPVPLLSGINLSFLFAGPIYDLATRRRIHPVYVFGCLFALATFTPIRFVVGATPWWHRVAHLVAGI